jgi:hypothetical protein
MWLLLTLTLLLNQGSNCSGVTFPGVTFKVLSQRVTDEEGYLPGNNRRAVFRLTNGAKRHLIVFGSKYEDGDFGPTGYIVKLDEETGRWVYPNPANSPTPWSQVSDRDPHILRPGRSIDVEAEFNLSEVGRRFKRTMLVAFVKDAEPCEVMSEELTVR